MAQRISTVTISLLLCYTWSNPHGNTFYSERPITSNWTIICQVCVVSDRRLLDILGNNCRSFCIMIASSKDIFRFFLLKPKVPHKQVQRGAASLWGILQDGFAHPQTAPVNHRAWHPQLFTLLFKCKVFVLFLSLAEFQVFSQTGFTSCSKDLWDLKCIQVA